MTAAHESLQWRWCRFDELNVFELDAIYRARQQVFAIEQACAYLDADGFDQASWHLAAWSPAHKVPRRAPPLNPAAFIALLAVPASGCKKIAIRIQLRFAVRTQTRDCSRSSKECTDGIARFQGPRRPGDA